VGLSPSPASPLGEEAVALVVAVLLAPVPPSAGLLMVRAPSELGPVASGLVKGVRPGARVLALSRLEEREGMLTGR
jgi:hypothetical protein